MSTPALPLFFPQALNSPGLWTELGKTHGLAKKDFEWFAHLKLSSHALRNQQKPPMHAEKIMIGADGLSFPLAGSFVLSPAPDDQGVILYTPYGGIKKFDSRTALSEQVKSQLDDANEDDEPVAFLSLSARKTLAAATDITLTFETIEGDVFEDQRAVININQHINDQAMVDELQKLPTLATLLDTVLEGLLKTGFPALDQRKTRVAFYADNVDDTAVASSPAARRWTDSMSLSQALLSYYRHKGWPKGKRPEFSHPQRTAQTNDQTTWETAIKAAAQNLSSRMGELLQQFWNEASADGATRRAFFFRAVREKARAELLLKRESGIITEEQSRDLQALVESASTASSTLTLETVRLWEYQPNYVELAGSLMISQDSSKAFLYTPAQGLQVLEDYQDLKDTLEKKSTQAGHDDELYDLMSLEERNRFIGFHQPQVSGSVITGTVFKTLFEAIISKQQQNLEYTLQVFRFSDEALDIHAFFDKALDIRSLINESLLTIDVQGRWSTRPVLSGKHPSIVLADTAAGYVKRFRAVEVPMRSQFEAQPVATLTAQRAYLEEMKANLAHAFSVALRGEAALRELSASLKNADWHVVDTVFNHDRADRKSRTAVRGFYPDAYSLVLECSGETQVLPLANCVLLTERGGIDIQHSGRAILWTPATGLEVFATVGSARQQLNLRLLDPDHRLALLENLTPAQRKLHRRYSLNTLRLITGNVLHHLAQSAIELFLARCEQVRSLKLKTAQQDKALKALTQTLIDTNLRRASEIAQAISHQQSLPAWLGMAPVEEQQLHVELLEQYRNNVTDDKDYLHGIQTLEDYVREKLKALLTARFPGKALDPDVIEITPNLALAGPAQSLTGFALNHVNIAQGTGFKVASGTTQALPEGLNQAAVRQLLLSLDIAREFGNKVTEALTGSDTATRKLRFVKQLPWQLLQHAHALKLQQHLSHNAFDLITQVLDLPDAIARATVAGAHAIVRPLELIKTAGAAAVKASGLYLISPGAAEKGSHVLYAPYHTGEIFSEFADEASLVAAINTPGALQELIVRRLPDNERNTFSNLFKSSAGQLSEITLGNKAISGNLLSRLFSDNTGVISHLLGSQGEATRQPDWEAVKSLFSTGIKLISGLLPGKLAYGRFLWQAYKNFKASAEALQDHHWKRALQSFIAGGVQMVTLGRLSLEAESLPPQAASEAEPVPTPVVSPKWSDMHMTAPARTSLQRFESTGVALTDLAKSAKPGTYLESISKKRYAPIAGKVYPVTKPGLVWRIQNGKEAGPSLLSAPSGQLVIDPDVHTVHFSRTLSDLRNQYVYNFRTQRVINIEARGMQQIRNLFPFRALMIEESIAIAREYAANCLHNLVQLGEGAPGTRLDTFLRRFFDVESVDETLLKELKKAILPVCNALADPSDELLDTARFVVGRNRDAESGIIAFVMDQDNRRNVHFTEDFFEQQLGHYSSYVPSGFNIGGHARASTVLHELGHINSKTVDFATLEARRPFTDLISSLTSFGANLKSNQLTFQREALSLLTPEEKLFARWDGNEDEWVDVDEIEGMERISEKILEVTGARTIAEAKTAFLDPVNPAVRINVILRNADSLALLIGEMGRQLDPVSVASTSKN
ncbi:dermonecrotic toxin domain-containing protein [Pseudomonas migulae]|uniref:dermonecrotic toxin domain-containing protein n=1 Tax=Pseudomonas migulae TaxID=78543 RepID=UPI003718BC82